jgi:hypothetical protein
MNKRALIRWICGLLLISLFTGVVTWYRMTEPLVSNGLQTFIPGDTGHEEFIIALRNEGYGKIELLSVKVNDRETPDLIQLVIAYDSKQTVQILSEPEPAIEFMDIKASPIFPALSPEMAQTAIKKKAHTPIHYGLRVRADSKIKSVILKYKYLGLVKTQIITRWFND